VFLPLLPMLGIILYFASGQELVLLVPLFINYVIIPILDWVFGSDINNPPEEIVPQLEEDHYYRWLTWLTVPLHFVTLIAVAWFVASYDLSPWSILILAITAGAYSGLGINTAHELGHKKTRIEQTLAKIALMIPAYGHFCVEHNHGHHRYVATPDDPASARMGESIYRFALREIPGAFQRGWQVESDRLTRRGRPTWSLHNNILQSYIGSLILQGGLIIVFGWIMIPFLAIHNFWAWYQLTSANYIEHYGLLREKDTNGRFERCKPHHSWNANYIFSNIVLFQLERHSDHHANASRRYQCLRNFTDIPELPNGYVGT
jgi:alkane 1-monooxygenase